MTSITGGGGIARTPAPLAIKSVAVAFLLHRSKFSWTRATSAGESDFCNIAGKNVAAFC
jgi:hypothetical protein